MVGCSSGGTTTEGSDQKETTTEAKTLSYKLDDGKFEIIRVEMRTKPNDILGLNIVLKNNTDETFDKVEVCFTVYKDKDVLGYDGNGMPYTNLEPGKESDADQWVAPLYFAEQDGFDVGDKDFTHIEVNELRISGESKKIEPIIITKEEMTQMD